MRRGASRDERLERRVERERRVKRETSEREGEKQKRGEGERERDAVEKEREHMSTRVRRGRVCPINEYRAHKQSERAREPALPSIRLLEI